MQEGASMISISKLLGSDDKPSSSYAITLIVCIPSDKLCITYEYGSSNSSAIRTSLS